MKLKKLYTTYKGVQIPRDRTSVNYDIAYLHYGDIYKIYNTRLNLNAELSTIIKISKTETIKPFQYLIHGDIVMNLTSENYEDLGKSLIIINPDNIPLVAGMETHILRTTSQDVISTYMQYFFESSEFSRQISQYAYGMKVFRAKPNHFGEIDLSLPTLDVQQHIVDTTLKGVYYA